MKREYPMDRSAAFTALLENSTVFARLDMNAGSEVTSQFLTDWYASTELNMWTFAREWVVQWEQDTKVSDEEVREVLQGDYRITDEKGFPA